MSTDVTVLHAYGDASADGRSPRTARSHAGALNLPGDLLVSRGHPTDPAEVHPHHSEVFIADLQIKHGPATVAPCYRCIRAFSFRADGLGEIRRR